MAQVGIAKGITGARLPPFSDLAATQGSRSASGSPSSSSLWVGAERKLRDLGAVKTGVSSSLTSTPTPFRVRASSGAARPATPEKPSTMPALVLEPMKEISETVKLPGSKSHSNRILLLAALSEGTTVVDNLLNSDDVQYMLNALKTLGLLVEDDSAMKRTIIEGCGGQFPIGKQSNEIYT